MNTAVVVGAGPAGSLVASGLAARGWNVQVFEKRGDLNVLPPPSERNRVYPMSLSQKTVRALEFAGLKLQTVGPSQGVAQKGAYFNGKPTPRMASSENPSWLIDRLRLGRELHLAAKNKTYPSGSIDWHWNTALEDVDFENKTALFTASDASTATTTRTAVKYDLLVGADGSYSAVRKAMLKHVPGLSVQPMFASHATYKTFHGLPVTPEAQAFFPALKDMLPRQGLFSWRAPDKVSVVCWLTEENTVSGMLVHKTYEEAVLRPAVSEVMKGAPQEWIDGVVEQTKAEGAQKPSSFGQNVSVSQFHGPSCVLVGDAAHPVTSMMGNGCNLALDGVRVFLETLDKAGPAQAPAAFTKVRSPDVRAYQYLELQQALNFSSTGDCELFGEVRAPTWWETTWARLLMQISSLPYMMIRKVLPSVFKANVLWVDWLMAGDKSFSQVLRLQQVSTAGVLAVAAAVLVGVATVLLKAVLAAKAAMGV